MSYSVELHRSSSYKDSELVVKGKSGTAQISWCGVMCLLLTDYHLCLSVGDSDDLQPWS